MGILAHKNTAILLSITCLGISSIIGQIVGRTGRTMIFPSIGIPIVTALILFLAFGAAFEVPVATYLVVRTGISTVDALSAKRPYIIVGAFVVGMVLTPPDIISQTMLALPVWLLYEVGLLLCRFTLPVEGSDEASSSA